MFRISDYGLVKHIRLGILQHDRKTHIEFQVTRLKVKVIMSHKETIISSAIAINIFNEKTSYNVLHIPKVDEKRERHVELWFKRSKVNLPVTFWLPFFLTGYLNTSWSVLGRFSYKFCC